MIRSPLANLDSVPVRPGLVAVVAVLFGSTAFDSFQDSTRWIKFIQGDTVQRPHLGAELCNNLALLAFCAWSAGCSRSARC